MAHPPSRPEIRPSGPVSRDNEDRVRRDPALAGQLDARADRRQICGRRAAGNQHHVGHARRAQHRSESSPSSRLGVTPGPFYCPGSGREMMESADTWTGSVASPDLAGRPHEAARTGRTALLRRRAQVSSGASRRAGFCDDARGIRRQGCSGSCRGHPAHGRHSGGWPRAGSGSAPCSARWRWPRWSGRRDCAAGGARQPGTGLHRR